jgi:hypothetical protein
LRFEVFHPLQSGLLNPGAAGAFGLGTVPGGKLDQRLAAGFAASFVQRSRQRPKIADHAFLLSWNAIIATLPELRDNPGH